MVRNRALGMNAKRRLYERALVPAALYEAEIWSVREAERNRLHVFEMRCLRNMVGVTRRDRVSNEEVRRRAGIVRKMSERVDQTVLSRYGQVVRMDEECLSVEGWSGPNLRGRP